MTAEPCPVPISAASPSLETGALLLNTEEVGGTLSKWWVRQRIIREGAQQRGRGTNFVFDSPIRTPSPVKNLMIVRPGDLVIGGGRKFGDEGGGKPQGPCTCERPGSLSGVVVEDHGGLAALTAGGVFGHWCFARLLCCLNFRVVRVSRFSKFVIAGAAICRRLSHAVAP